MSNDIAQTGLKEAPQVDWDNYNSGGSKYVAPPIPLGADGRSITFYGVASPKEDKPDQDYLNFLLDPIKIVRSGAADGYLVRFTRASLRPFMKNGEPMRGNPNMLANFLRACGVQNKPQRNDEYRLAVKNCSGRPFPFTADWEAYNKDTDETIKGYTNFPEDPDHPGQRKAIIRAGDLYTVTDKSGNIVETKKFRGEIAFANLRLRYFQDPSRGK